MSIEVGPPWSWSHRLHQATGIIALRGGKLSRDDMDKIRVHLEWVLGELKNESQTRAGDSAQGAERPGSQGD